MSSNGVVNAIEAKQVSKVFGTGDQRVTALDDVSVHIRQNEFFTLLGPSGCGKTTLLRLIAGFDQPTAGNILLMGEDISLLPPYQRPVNTVFQSYALFPHMTVAENIGFGLLMQGKPKQEIDQTVERMLDLVQMQKLKDRRTSEISGGQQQRVALARALAPHPKVLLLDEPLSALDYKLRKEMQIELKRLQNETGITFVFVTHDQEEALTMSDRIAVMDHGVIRQIGTPHEIYDHPADRFVASFIGETNFIAGQVVSSRGNKAKISIPSGAKFDIEIPDGMTVGNGQDVSLVVRPEHASITTAKAGSTLKGTLSNVVYFGTDTHFYVDVGTQAPFIVRAQNRRNKDSGLKVGDAVGVAFADGALQVLRD
jgi:spermidine/putrescine transport system ATP-binding protein